MSENKNKTSLTVNTRKIIIEKIDSGRKIDEISREFSVSKSCLYKLKKHRMEFEENSSKLAEYSDYGDRKRLRLPKFEKTDKALYYWFRQQRALNRPVTDDLLRVKAIQFHEKLADGDEFTASNGFLQGFKQRYCIKSKVLKGEIASADNEAADNYVNSKFPPIASKFTRKTTYNMDEFGLQYRAMPEKSLVARDDSCEVRKYGKLYDMFSHFPTFNREQK